MAEERSQVYEQEGKVLGFDSETRSTSVSEAARNRIDANDEAAFMNAGQSADKTAPAETSASKAESSAEAKKAPLPSHSPLAFANYPPVWTSNPRPKPNPQAAPSSSKTSERSQSGFSAATLSAVMSAGSPEDSSRGKRFEERDPSNPHGYIQAPERRVESHGRLNIFGRDIGGLGKGPPSMRFRRQKGK